MRVRILHSALVVVALSLGCEREPGPQPGPEPGPGPGPAPGPTGTTAARSGTVKADSVFRLVWPDEHAPKACIEIPANAVSPGTEVTISMNVNSNNPSDWPAAFRDWHERAPGRTVYMPLIEFSANPEFTITDRASFFTVGICARYRRGADDPDPELLEDDPTADPGASARVAHASGDTLAFLTPEDTPCPCRRLGPNPGQGALSRAGALLAGTPLLPDRLEASAVAEQGLGGKGGSFSPFGVVRQ